MGSFKSLHVKLSLVFLLLFSLTGFLYLLLVYWSTSQYHQELSQELNSNIAMYVAQRDPLIENGVVNYSAVTELANQAMVINPIVEIYLLDNTGKILAHTLPKDSIQHSYVDLAPIKLMLSGQARLPLQGDNPRDSNNPQIFSVFPIETTQGVEGYVYAMLGGKHYQSLVHALQASHIFKISLAGILAIVLLGFSLVYVIFRVLTRPLQRLVADMNEFQTNELNTAIPDKNSGDELSALRNAFTAMAIRIREQFERLRQTDQVRRELVSNVSHDLRTPLASMQGYLETLLVKDLDASKQHEYVAVAHRHCQRLTRLVSELFELSKLDTGRITPNWERFSLAELLQDVMQKFQLVAQGQGIDLSIKTPVGPYMVFADIALIERVMENLIDNALRFTPAGGKILIELSRVKGRVNIVLTDSGVGIHEKEIPLIFDRYYQGGKYQGGKYQGGKHQEGKNRSIKYNANDTIDTVSGQPIATPKNAINNQDEATNKGTGLGLAIVKRIVELHGSAIEVSSKLNQGTSFSFSLATAE